MKALEYEKERFLNTKNLIAIELKKTEDKLIEHSAKHQLSNQEMLGISKDYASDDVRAALSQSLQIFQQESANNERLNEKIRALAALEKQPYFGKFDLEGEDESYYVGLSHFMDSSTLDLLVYDWRAPISSLFYEQSYGQKTYMTPEGKQTAFLSLKRHFYSTEKGLSHYYDMDATPADDYLIEILSEKNQQQLSPIVQSIQKKQNQIIRSEEVDLLNIQGVPGSGKSIIALHRMAYLLYHSKGIYTHNNMVILSPNDAFKVYIENVLPALGERMNLQYTMEDLLENSLGTLKYSKKMFLNDLMTNKRRVMPFKNSKSHYLFLKAWLKYYLNHLHPFEDFYFDNQLILKSDDIKDHLINQCTKKPLEVILSNYRSRLQSLLEYPMKVKFDALEEQVSKHNIEPGDAEKRLKKLKRHFYQKINRYTQKVLTLDFYKIYKMMYEKPETARMVGGDLNIPKEFFSSSFHYEDYFAQMCLKLWIVEERSYKHIQYLLVDESQDYEYIPYQILKSLFYNAKITLVGDVDQSLVHREMNFFEMTSDVFEPESKEEILLKTCYRSTEKIVNLAQSYMPSLMKHIGRPGEPAQVYKESINNVMPLLVSLIDQHKEKNESGIVIITSSEDQTRDIGLTLKERYQVTMNQNDDLKTKDVLILPIYEAKGFEFDRLIYLRTKLQENLQQYVDYTAITRAKHHVILIDTLDVI